MNITTDSVLAELIVSTNAIHNHLKELAPSGNTYKGIDNFKPVEYIFVNNKRVYTSTGNLKRSVVARERKNGINMIHDVYVSGASVPYYAKAVLSQTLTRAKHYGRLEYGETRYTSNVRWKSSVIETISNRNYMYFQKGIGFIRSELGKYNGKKIYVSDDIGRWQNGV